MLYIVEASHQELYIGLTQPISRAICKCLPQFNHEVHVKVMKWQAYPQEISINEERSITPPRRMG